MVAKIEEVAPCKHELAMSKRKRTEDSAPTTSLKKRKVTVTTFNKWKTQVECDHNTLSWLRCDVTKEDKMVVEMLWCEACRKHEDSIVGMKNSKAWITGSSNQKTSNIIEHATSEQHCAAMVQIRADAARASNQLLTSYPPIARSIVTVQLVFVNNLVVSDHVRPKLGLVWHSVRPAFENYNAHCIHRWNNLPGPVKESKSISEFKHYIWQTFQVLFIIALLLSTCSIAEK